MRELVAISVPMHTALRIGIELAKLAAECRPTAHVCLFGLYAWMHAEELLGSVADSVIGGEFEASLVELASRLSDRLPLTGIPGVSLPGAAPVPPLLARLELITPRRDGSAPARALREARRQRRGRRASPATSRPAAAATHRCRHCPITPVYDGRFFVVPRDVVLADVAQQVAAGARHITFGDPDFFNGPRHGLGLLRALHAAHPELTFDVTIKVEHFLRTASFCRSCASSAASSWSRRSSR